MQRLCYLLVALGALALGCVRPAPPDAPAAGANGASGAGADPGLASITARDLRATVELLAADEYEGRETLQPGARRAAAHLAAEMQRYGLRPMPGAEGFEVPYTLHALGYDEGSTRARIAIPGDSFELEPGVDFVPFPFSQDGEAEAEVVFAGYGITAPELGYDDYAGLDVKDKLVFVLRYTPRAADGAADRFAGTGHAMFATKARNAAAHGARGMILVTGPLHRDGPEDLRLDQVLRVEPIDGKQLSQRPGQSERPPFLAVRISQLAASRLVASTGRPLRGLQGAIDTGTPAAELAFSATRASLGVKAETKSRPVTAYNVAGFLVGSDPLLRDEWIVVGAHYDHLGGTSGADDDGVFNGADDNASGTAGMLELAQAFSTAASAPRRSMLFVGFSGEEKGLLGSRAMIAQDILPIDKVVFMLNLDMIGRNESEPVAIYGDGFVDGFAGVVEAANAEIGLDIALGGADYSGASDHHPFYLEGVPFSFFFTGLHDDYHQLSDHADKISYDRMQDIVRLAYGTVRRLAAAPTAPRFIHRITWLGAAVKVEGEGEGARAKVIELEHGSRGAEAGLRVGDVLTAVNGESMPAGGVGPALAETAPGTSVSLAVARDAPTALTVERAKTGYLGVFPGQVGEEQRQKLGLPAGEGVLIRGVSPGGPAAAAGFEDGDILVRIAGLPVDIGSLGARLARIGAGEKVQATVLRAGKRLQLELVLGERPDRP